MLGSFGLSPISQKCPKILPAVFCECDDPRCAPIPQKFIAIASCEYLAIDNPHNTLTPMLCRSFSLNLPRFFESVGRGKVSAVILAISRPRVR